MNIPLAVPLPEYAAIERAVNLSGFSRNRFLIECALNRSREILAEHGELQEHDIDAFAEDDEPAHPAA